jgi:hypothetical protein
MAARIVVLVGWLVVDADTLPARIVRITTATRSQC